MKFADNLKNVRKDQKLSQQELADKLNIAQSTVGMWEADRRTPKLDEIRRISAALNVTVERLISENTKKIEIINNEIYIDGKKVSKLDGTDIASVLSHIQSILSTKDQPTDEDKKSISKGKKILIIDDEKLMCETLYSYLVPHNYKVFLTFNGQMGLEYFQEIKPDVILLDLTMPDMEGLDVLKIIRKVSDVPVLIITAHPEEIADIHLSEMHIEGYIEKPFSLEQLLNTLKHLLGE